MSGEYKGGADPFGRDLEGAFDLYIFSGDPVVTRVTLPKSQWVITVYSLRYSGPLNDAYLDTEIRKDISRYRLTYDEALVLMNEKWLKDAAIQKSMMECLSDPEQWDRSTQGFIKEQERRAEIWRRQEGKAAKVSAT